MTKEERKIIIEKKFKILEIKNILKEFNKNIKGIEIIKVLEEKEIKKINEIYSEYIKTYNNNSKINTIKNKINYKTSESEICKKIIENINIKNNNEYFLYCQNKVWIKIKILDSYNSIKFLFNHQNHQFLLMETNMKKIIEFGLDSRDEYNFIIDIWNT